MKSNSRHRSRLLIGEAAADWPIEKALIAAEALCTIDVATPEAIHEVRIADQRPCDGHHFAFSGRDERLHCLELSISADNCQFHIGIHPPHNLRIPRIISFRKWKLGVDGVQKVTAPHLLIALGTFHRSSPLQNAARHDHWVSEPRRDFEEVDALSANQPDILCTNPGRHSFPPPPIEFSRPG
jgi:hypothetical protein